MSVLLARIAVYCFAGTILLAGGWYWGYSTRPSCTSEIITQDRIVEVKGEERIVYRDRTVIVTKIVHPDGTTEETTTNTDIEKDTTTTETKTDTEHTTIPVPSEKDKWILTAKYRVLPGNPFTPDWRDRVEGAVARRLGDSPFSVEVGVRPAAHEWTAGVRLDF
jgi:hypothetical protein